MDFDDSLTLGLVLRCSEVRLVLDSTHCTPLNPDHADTVICWINTFIRVNVFGLSGLLRGTVHACFYLKAVSEVFLAF